MRNIFLAVLLLTIVSSCSKSFLERTPIDKQVEEDFYKTPEDAFEALVSAYSVLNWSGYGNIVLNAEIASDNCFGGAGIADNGVKQWDRFETFNDHNAEAWKKYYTGIFRTNKFLQKIDEVNFGSNTALKDQYTGEAKFLRAYFYFDLARMFGDVPLLTEPIEGENYYIPPSPADSVYMLIAADLKDAVAKLAPSAKKFNEIPAGEYGRVTKWAAQALLARVYLYYTGYYSKPDLAGYTKQDAANAVEDVIQNSGHELIPNYANLWRAASGNNFAGQNNKEGIFVIQYSMKGLGNWDLQNGNRFTVLVSIRNQVLDPYYKGWGFATVNPALWNSFETGDVRKSASIISIVDENLPYNTATSDQFQYTGYFWKKYTAVGGPDRPDNNGGDFQIDNYDNYVVIRLADVFLMGAELNLATNLAKAQDYFNRVRDRAFNNDITRRKVLTNDANGVRLIMNERKLELSLEGQRYWDLLRQGLTVAKQAIDNTVGGTEFTVTFRPETKGLFELPQTQIGLSNGTLKQNNGW